MNYTALLPSLKLMGQSMTAIFIVMGVISFIVYLFTRFLDKETKD